MNNRLPKSAAVNTYLTRRPAACPACHTMLNGATGVKLDDTRCPPPEPGDITVCAECTAILAWTTDGTFRFASQAELDELEPHLRRLVTEFKPKW